MVSKNKRRATKPSLIANNTTFDNCIKQQRYDYIPIDFIKAEIIGLCKDHFLKNNELTFTPVLEQGTTDTIKYSYNEYENIIMKVYESGRIYLSGSLHKFYNNGLHNYNEFNQSEYFQTLERIKSIYGIEAYNIRIIQLEYGVNILPPIPTPDILNNLIQHKNKDFEQKISNYYQCEHANYIIKVYNKALQYRCKDEILRIEIKQTNWSEYRKKGFTTLHDFNKSNKYQFVNNLLTKWNDIIFYDPTNILLEKWGKYSHLNFWRELRTKSPPTQKKHRDRIRKLNSNKGLNIQKLVSDEVIKSINKLQGVRNFNLVETQRYCRLTGVNISMQRNDSFLLSHGGLYYLIEHDFENFKRVKKKFLSNNWLTSSIDKQVKEIAHNIRVKYNYRVKKYEGKQLTMFNPMGGKLFQVYI